MTGSEATAAQQALALDIERVFDAPRELIWKLWREPEHMVRWHGPEGIALLDCDIDFRVGGRWRRTMSSGPGHRHVISGAYLEIVEPRRLSFSYVNEYDGFETVVTMDFEEAPGGRTRMLFRQTPFISEAERDGHGWGWNSGFTCFAEYLTRFIDDDWRPKGLPRRDGVAEDFAAAKARAEGRKTEEERHEDRRTADR